MQDFKEAFDKILLGWYRRWRLQREIDRERMRRHNHTNQRTGSTRTTQQHMAQESGNTAEWVDNNMAEGVGNKVEMNGSVVQGVSNMTYWVNNIAVNANNRAVNNVVKEVGNLSNVVKEVGNLSQGVDNMAMEIYEG